MFALFISVFLVMHTGSWCRADTDIDFEQFEAIYFPRVIKFNREAETRPLPQIGFHDLVYQKDVMEKCAALGYTPNECGVLWNGIKLTVYNPEGNLFTRDYLEGQFSEQALMAEHLNFQTICKDGEDCLLHQDNEFAAARVIFSPYSSAEILQMRRVVFLHSCSMPGGSTAVLEELLAAMKSSGLLQEADRVFVINYGVEIPESVMAQYREAVFVEASADYARFEIPTLQIVHYFSRLFNALRRQAEHIRPTGADSVSLDMAGEVPDCQVLYVHTKGVSTSVDIAPVADWRRFMTFFVVTHHRKCRTLMDSGLYDAIGVNVRRSPKYPSQGEDELSPHFSGNFWWSRTSYLSGLPFLSLGRNSKYDGEFWIGSAAICRMLSMHDSLVDDHYGTPYPFDAYADNKLLQTTAPL
jgi:hypothetical protein